MKNANIAAIAVTIFIACMPATSISKSASINSFSQYIKISSKCIGDRKTPHQIDGGKWRNQWVRVLVASDDVKRADSLSRPYVGFGSISVGIFFGNVHATEDAATREETPAPDLSLSNGGGDYSFEYELNFDPSNGAWTPYSGRFRRIYQNAEASANWENLSQQDLNGGGYWLTRHIVSCLKKAKVAAKPQKNT